MKIFELVNEESDEYIKKIKRECSDILEIYRYNEGYLYHGFKSSHKNEDIFISTTRLNRIPKDTPDLIQKAIDNELISRGFKAIRSNSLFCINNKSYALSYGKLYIIFPLNGFNYTWFKHSDDLFETINDWLHDNKIGSLPTKKDIKKYHCTIDNRVVEYLINNMHKFIDQCSPVNNELLAAIERKNEIMISNCNYYALTPFYFKTIKSKLYQ